MQIAVLGTGMVGQTLAAKLAANGHAVTLGTRDPAATSARTAPDPMSGTSFSAWHADHPAVQLAAFAEASAPADIILLATSGFGTLEALQQAGAANLDGKVIMDITNPLDFSQGMPPSLFVSNTDSLGEQIQRAYPSAKVVKALNTVTAALMVNPGLLPGTHDMFISGNDADAKASVSAFLMREFGWQSVIDLGDITAARGMEMYLPLWVRLFGALRTPLFNVQIVRPQQ